MRFFFYGTLLDRDVRAMVLPHVFEELCLTPAELTGWQRVQARHGSFPVIRPRPGARLAGLLVEGIDRRGLYRMAHFEGDGYTAGLLPVTARGRRLQAAVFLPERRALCLSRGWSLDTWQRRHKRRFLPRIQGWMNEFSAQGPWSGDLSWHARRRLAEIARVAPGEDGAAEAWREAA